MLALIVLIIFTTPGISQDKATVYVIRSIGLNTVKTALLDNGKELVDLKDKSYAVLDLEPGEHIFSVQKEKREKLLIELEGGKTYYLLIVLQYYTSFKWEYYCVELSERSGKRLLLEDLKKHEL